MKSLRKNRSAENAPHQMKNGVAQLAAALVVLVGVPAFADPVVTKQGVTYCTVTDTGQVPAQIWASPIFEFSYASSDPTSLERTNQIASEFLTYVGTLGGAGSKRCVSGTNAAQAEALRNEERARWSKRLFLMKAGHWHEVDWQPAPWNPSLVDTTKPVLGYYRCYATNVDVRRTVTSGVFEVQLPASDLQTKYANTEVYAREFDTVLRSNGLPDPAMCVPYDTRAEAEKDDRDYRRMFSGFNLKYQEVSWRPTVVVPAAAKELASPTASPVGAR